MIVFYLKKMFILSCRNFAYSIVNFLSTTSYFNINTVLLVSFEVKIKLGKKCSEDNSNTYAMFCFECLIYVHYKNALNIKTRLNFFFLNGLNNLHQNLNFTKEEEHNNSLVFLDVCVQRSVEGELLTKKRNNFLRKRNLIIKSDNRVF